MWSSFVNYFKQQDDSILKGPTNEGNKENINMETDHVVDYDVPELDVGNYNDGQAHLRLNVLWLLSKAYSKEELPENLRNPFTKNPDGALTVAPCVHDMLVSGELYVKASLNVFGQCAHGESGHWAIIEALSKRGLYVVGSDDSAVTATDLKQTSPLLLNCHLALIDTLMQAYTKEVVTIERVVQAVRRFATFNASSELPYDIEDSLLFWINKVCSTVRHRLEKETKIQQQALLQNQSPQKVRINKKQLTPKQERFIPVMDDLLQDLSDGCCLATLLHYYCPECLLLQDLALKDSMSFADSVHNIQVVESFCDKYLPSKCFHFQCEDLLYGHNFTKPCVLSFLSELFYYMEVSRLDCVTPNKFTKDSTSETGFKPVSAQALKTSSSVAISNVTKKSFQQATTSPGPDDTYNQFSSSKTELNKVPSSPSHVLRQPLLQKRIQNQREGSTVCYVDESRTMKTDSLYPAQVQSQTGTVPAQDINNSIESRTPTQVLISSSQSSEGSRLLSNVRIDPQLSESFDTDCITSKDLEMADTNTKLRDEQDSDKLELESVSSFSSARSDRAGTHREFMEPLMPAMIKHVKEKSYNPTKEYERGDVTRLSEKSDDCELQRQSEDSDTLTNVSTSLPPGVDLSIMKSLSVPVKANITVSTDLMVSGLQEGNAQSKAPAESFTIPDHPHSPNSARAAGIPIVDSTESTGSLKTSVNQFEHIESSKIHADQNGRETDTYIVNPTPRQVDEKLRPDSLFVPKPIVVEKDSYLSSFIGLKKGTELKPSPTTNFAEIKRWRDSIGPGETTSLVYVQHGDRKDFDKPEKISLREEFERKKKKPTEKPKKTTFASLPNQTNWQESAEKSAKFKDSNRYVGDSPDTIQPLVSELASVRMQLEQKRRAMEHDKRRMETQLNKQRQRVGKAAFMHVLSKNKGNEASSQAVGRPASTPIPAPQLPHTVVPESDVKPKSVSPHVFTSNSPQPTGQKSTQPVVTDVYSGMKLRHNIEEPVRPVTPISRQSIQEAIEDVKQRWFANEASMSPQVRDSRNEPQPLSGGASPRSVGSDDYDEYNQSLEKLNHSLSELQGEIMRLSLQQEQIKHLASESGILNKPAGPVLQKPTMGPVVHHTPTGPVVQRHTPTRPGFHRQLSADNAIPPPVSPMHLLDQTQGAIRIHNASLADKTISPLATSGQLFSELRGHDQGFRLHQPQQGEAVTPYNMSQSSYSDGVPAYDMARSSLSDPGLYISPANLNGQATLKYQMEAHGLSPASRHQVEVQGLSPARYTEQNQQPFVLHSSPVTTSPRQVIPSPYQHHATYGTSSCPVQSHPPQGAGYYIPSPSSTEGLLIQTDSNSIQASHMTSPPTTSVLGYNMTSDHVSTYSQSEADPLTHQLPVDTETCLQLVNGSHVAEHGANDISLDSDKEQRVDDKPLNSGFFVSFDEPTPVKAKPKRKGWEKPKSAKTRAQDSSPAMKKSVKVIHSPVEGKVDLVHSPASGDSPQRTRQDKESVGFVIGDDETKLDVSTEFDIQKKREKLMLQQLKRKENMGRKRLQKEAEAAQNREDVRLKKLEAEQKKAEEKSRREVIYQQYLNRKAEEDDDKSSPRQQKSRPKSSKHKSSSNNGSDKNISHDGSKSGNGSVSVSQSYSNQTDSGQFSYGGLTHRASSPTSDRPQLTSRKPSALTSLADSGSDAGSAASDYLGPKLYVKPSSKSNRHIIINAVSHCCLAGSVNDELKAKVLEEVAKSDEKHFIILFRDVRQKYRSLYSYCPDREEVLKIHGTGPKQITNKMIERYFKYNSGGKSFNQVTSTKHLSVSIDAITIKDTLWAKKPVATKKAGGSYR